MKFDKSETVEALAYDMKLADWPRANNRAAINKLYNGHPPYTQSEVEENNIAVNCNFLEQTRIAHDARAQFSAVFQKPGNFFKATTDYGSAHNAPEWSQKVTHHMNRIMKRSIPFFECFRSTFASDVLHGIGPTAWRTGEHWCPEPLGIEDVLIPSNTLLTMHNLPFFFLYHSWTAPELIRMARGSLDQGWDQELVERCIRWVDTETTSMMGDSDWPDVWSPEKMEERLKGDGAYYASDRCPTINVFDFFFWSDEKDNQGWKRRVILDSWSTPSAAGQGLVNRRTNDKEFPDSKGKFLYTSNDKNYANKREEIVSFQFADLSAVAPFKYHTIRSLGFLLYAVCHLQNRLRCRFTESVFEQMMIYMRVKSQDDAQRALKVKLGNFAFFDETMSFIPANERFQVNANLVELGLQENATLIKDNSTGYTTNPEMGHSKTEKTKFEVMAKVNAATSLVSVALAQAYTYQKPQYTEIFRRFCIANSSDPDVREFRAACFKDKIPAKVLLPEAWEIEPERVMGAGNKTLEMAISEQLMQLRPMMDPEPQRTVLHDVILAITDDPARAKSLVPDKAVHVTDSVHDAQLAAGVLMQGLPVALKTGMNHIEYVETLMATMASIVMKIQQQQKGVATPEQLQGLQNMAQNIGQHIGVIAQDKAEQQRVKKYGDQLGKLMNMVKAFAQRLQEQQKAQAEQAQQNGNGGIDPKDLAKIKGQLIISQAKAKNMRESHAQKSAQRQIQFQQKIQQDAQKHQANIAATDLETAAEIQRNRIRSLSEDQGEE